MKNLSAEELIQKYSNATVMPKIYYGLHFSDGVAEYSDINKTIYVSERVAQKMNATFAGCPLYVNHLDGDVSPENIEEADGYVVESFFNKSDGKHWAKFIVISDRAHEKIAKGWKLSNSFFTTSEAQGGVWHGVKYDNEVMEGKYEHLAIVENPRYAESIILTPDQFKAYNEKLDAEHAKVTNSLNGDKKMKGFKLFKREKIENSLDLGETVVVLEKSGKEMTLEKVLNSFDQHLVDSSKPQEAKATDLVKLSDKETITVAELKTKFENAKKKNEEYEKEKAENEDMDSFDNEDEDEDKKENGKHCNEDEDDKSENEDDEEEEKKKNSKKKNSMDNFNKLNNARSKVENSKQVVVSLPSDMVARGKELF